MKRRGEKSLCFEIKHLKVSFNTLISAEREERRRRRSRRRRRRGWGWNLPYLYRSCTLFHGSQPCPCHGLPRGAARHILSRRARWAHRGKPGWGLWEMAGAVTLPGTWASVTSLWGLREPRKSIRRFGHLGGHGQNRYHKKLGDSKRGHRPQREREQSRCLATRRASMCISIKQWRKKLFLGSC